MGISIGWKCLERNSPVGIILEVGVFQVIVVRVPVLRVGLAQEELSALGVFFFVHHKFNMVECARAANALGEKGPRVATVVRCLSRWHLSTSFQSELSFHG